MIGGPDRRWDLIDLNISVSNRLGFSSHETAEWNRHCSLVLSRFNSAIWSVVLKPPMAHFGSKFFFSLAMFLMSLNISLCHSLSLSSLNIKNPKFERDIFFREKQPNLLIWFSKHSKTIFICIKTSSIIF